MRSYFEKSYELRYFEMNRHGEASPTAILKLLEETAAEHCYEIENCLYSLERKNIGWVLLSGAIDMIRYPKYKERIFIRTWVSKYTLVRGYRENLIFDEYGNLIGKAKGIWAFYDVMNRKPVPVFEDIKTKWGINSEVSDEVEFDKIKIIENDLPWLEFNIYKSDIDNNNHVNNIRYFHWLTD